VLAFVALVHRPSSFEILRSVNHSHQLDTLLESDIENDMGFGGKTANPLLQNFRSLATYQWLLRQVTHDIIESMQISIGPRLTRFTGDPQHDDQPNDQRRELFHRGTSLV
jgi:hypothetical protein